MSFAIKDSDITTFLYKIMIQLWLFVIVINIIVSIQKLLAYVYALYSTCTVYEGG